MVRSVVIDDLYSGQIICKSTYGGGQRGSPVGLRLLARSRVRVHVIGSGFAPPFSLPLRRGLLVEHQSQLASHPAAYLQLTTLQPSPTVQPRPKAHTAHRCQPCRAPSRSKAARATLPPRELTSSSPRPKSYTTASASTLAPLWKISPSLLLTPTLCPLLPPTPPHLILWLRAQSRKPLTPWTPERPRTPRPRMRPFPAALRHPPSPTSRKVSSASACRHGPCLRAGHPS